MENLKVVKVIYLLGNDIKIINLFNENIMQNQVSNIEDIIQNQVNNIDLEIFFLFFYFMRILVNVGYIFIN